MGLSDAPSWAQRFADWLARRPGIAAAELTALAPLSGGAIQENWRVEARVDRGDGPRAERYVLRCDAPSTIEASLTRLQEFAVLKAAFAAGVRVPEPLWECDDRAVIGRPFYLMRYLDGIALGPKIVKDRDIVPERTALVTQLGIELARIHSVAVGDPALDWLGVAPASPGLAAVARLRAQLDALGERRPALEWALRWAEKHAPTPARLCLVHNDFRTGNFLIGNTGLVAILDWEFACWGDPMADVGWFCARCWRFSRPDLEAGGLAPRQDFYAAYERESGRAIDPAAVAYWELLAHVRWGVIALQQAYRHQSGEQCSLELALTGRMLAPLEAEALALTAPAAWSGV